MNTGKIFAESENIYQDQARVLFNYYKAAAEKIVSEEIDLENKIAETEEDKVENLKNRPLNIVLMVLFLVLGIVLVVAAFPSKFATILIPAIIVTILVPAIVFCAKIIGANKAAAACDARIAEYKQAKNDIRRDYKVHKMSVAYVPVKKNIPFGNGHIAVDLTESTNQTKFALSTIRKVDEWGQTLSTLNRDINAIPVVEGSNETENLDTSAYSSSIQNVTVHDYAGSIDRQVRNIKFLLDDSEKKSVTLPLVKPGSKEDRFIKDYATSSVAEGFPVVNVFNEAKFDAPVQVFNDINTMKKSLEQGDAAHGNHIEYYKKLMRTLGESVQYITESKIKGCNKLVNYCNAIFANVLKSSYIQYSPTLEAEEISRIKNVKFDYKEDSQNYKPFYLQASSRVKYDLFQSVWIAEDESRTVMPFSMSQLQEEIFAPLIENLMEENRKDRLKVYDNIEDQKRDYLNQWHQETQDFTERSRTNALNLTKDMAAAMSDFMAATNTYEAMKKTLDALKLSGSLNDGEVAQLDTQEKTLMAMKLKAEQCKAKQDEFQATMTRLHDDIDLRSEEFGYVEYFEGTLRDSEAQSVAQSADDIQNLDARRKVLLSVNSYMAKNATLPPAPSVNESMFEDLSVNLEEHVDGLLHKFEEGEITSDVFVEEVPTTVASTSYEENPSEKIGDEKQDGFEENMLVCPECGAENASDSLFCEECGHKFSNEAEA